MPVIILSTHNQGLEPPEERSSRHSYPQHWGTSESPRNPNRKHINFIRAPDFCLRFWEQEHAPYRSLMTSRYLIVLTTKEEDKLFW